MAYPPLYLLNSARGGIVHATTGAHQKAMTDDKSKDPSATWALKLSGVREVSPQTRIPVASPSVHHCAPTDPLPRSYPGVWSRSRSLLVGLFWNLRDGTGGPWPVISGQIGGWEKISALPGPVPPFPTIIHKFPCPTNLTALMKLFLSHRLEKRKNYLAAVAVSSVLFRLVAFLSRLLMKQLRGVCPCPSSCVRKCTMIHEPEWTQVARLHKESHVRSLHRSSIYPCPAAVESLLSPFFDFASASCLQSPRSPPGIYMGVGEVGESTD